jgi:VanZ family protein
MNYQRSITDWPIVRILPAAWAMATIWWLSDRETLPKPPGFSFEIWSILGHFVAFGLLGLFIWWGLGMNSRIWDRDRQWYAIGVAAAYGVLDEIHQHFVPGRQPDVLDVLTDLAGAIVFVMVVPRLYEKWFG